MFIKKKIHENKIHEIFYINIKKNYFLSSKEEMK